MWTNCAQNRQFRLAGYSSRRSRHLSTPRSSCTRVAICELNSWTITADHYSMIIHSITCQAPSYLIDLFYWWLFFHYSRRVWNNQGNSQGNSQGNKQALMWPSMSWMDLSTPDSEYAIINEMYPSEYISTSEWNHGWPMILAGDHIFFLLLQKKQIWKTRRSR